MITTKKIALIASLTLASTFAVADNTYNLDPLTQLTGTNILTSAGNFTTGVQGYFTDTFTFTVPSTFAAWNFDASFESVTASIFEFDAISLTNNSTGVTSTGVTGFSSAFSTATYTESSATGYTLLTPGSYSLFVSGIANFVDSEYTINAVLSPVSPIPEPSSIALMLGGLGLVGFMAARRRKNA